MKRLFTFIFCVMMLLTIGCSDDRFSAPAKLEGDRFVVDLIESDRQAPTNIYLLIDDSASMKDKQEKLAANLVEALKSLRGRDLTVHIYSSTLFSPIGFEPQSALMSSTGGTKKFSNYVGEYATVDGHLTGYNQKTRGVYLSNLVSTETAPQNGSLFPALRRRTFFEKSGIITPFVPNILFDHDKITEEYYLGPSGFSTPNGTVSLSADLTPDEFTKAIEKMGKEIAIGDKGSTSGEVLDCTLAYLVDELNRKNATLKAEDRRRSVFFLLGDEDHAKDANGNYLSCPTRYEANVKKVDTEMMYPKFYYEIKQVWIEDPADSGSSADSFTGHYYEFDFNFECLDGIGNFNCKAPHGTSEKCTQAESDAYYDDPRVTAHLLETKGRIPEMRKCQHFTRLLNADFPNFGNKGITVEMGTTLNSMGFRYKEDPKATVFQLYAGTPKEYFRERYPKVDLVADSVYFSPYSHKNVKPGFATFPGVTDLKSLHGFIKKSADQALGADNYQITVVGNTGVDNPSDCSAKPEERSEKLMELASPGQVLSICQNSYMPAIDGMKKFILYKTKTKYELPANIKASQFVRVYLRGEILKKDEHYIIENGFITIFPNNINGGIVAGDVVTFATLE